MVQMVDMISIMLQIEMNNDDYKSLVIHLLTLNTMHMVLVV